MPRFRSMFSALSTAGLRRCLVWLTFMLVLGAGWISARAAGGKLYSNGRADFAMFVLFMAFMVWLLSDRERRDGESAGERLAFRLGKTLNGVLGRLRRCL